VDRAEAEAIYDAGREVVVEVLLRMDEEIRRLEERVARQDERIAELEHKLNRNSRNSSARVFAGITGQIVGRAVLSGKEEAPGSSPDRPLGNARLTGPFSVKSADSAGASGARMEASRKPSSTQVAPRRGRRMRLSIAVRSVAGATAL